MDWYLIKAANWVRDLYHHKAIRDTADLQDESFPQGRVENKEGRERREDMIASFRVQHTGVLFCLCGLKSEVMIGEGYRILERDEL